MTTICLLALIGLPAVGKTTFCHWLLQNQSEFNTIHLCFDDLINVRDYLTNYKQQRSEVLQLLTHIVDILQKPAHRQTLEKELQLKHIVYMLHNKNNYLIICDDNHYYRSMRYRLYQICRQKQICYAQIYFECDVDTAQAHNAARANGTAQVPVEIINEMHRRLELPNSKDNFWENNTLIVTEKLHQCHEECINFIKKSFDLQLTYQCMSQKICIKQIQTTNSIHELDLLLRRRIKELLVGFGDSASKQVHFVTLNQKRKEILEQFKREQPIHELNLEDYSKLLDFAEQKNSKNRHNIQM